MANAFLLVLQRRRIVWPALDASAALQPTLNEAPPPPRGGTWRGNLLMLCGEENRTLALVLARLAGSIDAAGIELVGGYTRGAILRGLQLFAQAGVMRSKRTSAKSLAYELDPSFAAHREHVALIDAIVAHEPDKWEGRVLRLRRTRRREAFVPAATTAVRARNLRRYAQARLARAVEGVAAQER